MPGLTCLRFFGLRLDGHYVGVFDHEPMNYNVTSFHHGVADVCRKLKYPKPHDIKPLISEGELIATIPLSRVIGRYWFNRQAYPPPGYPSALAALNGMWSHPSQLYNEPNVNVFSLYLLAQTVLNPNFGWNSTLQITRQPMKCLRSAFQESWFTDATISFHLCLTAPVIAGVPDFVRFTFLDKNIAYNSGAYSTVIEKSSITPLGFEVSFTSETSNYTYAQYLTLPLIPFQLFRGFQYGGAPAFGPRIEVRRTEKFYKVCWPSDVINRAACVAVIDRGSGLVIGPPIMMD